MSDAGEVDVVSLLERQHEQIKALFQQTLAATGPDRVRGFLALRQLLATHEALEEEVVHPAAVYALRELGRPGHEIIRARLEEERTAATSITQLERMPIDSVAFEMNLRKLQHDVVEHADHEERFEFVAFERTKGAVPAGELRRVADAVQSEPTLQQRGVSRDVGPFVAMLNHAREILGAHDSLERGVDTSRERNRRDSGIETAGE